MNSDNLILRQTENAPLINKNDVLTSAEFDQNVIKIYNDLLANKYVSDATLTFSSIRSYITGEYATYNGRLWVATTESTGVAPTIDSFEWNDIFPSVLAHEKNKDTILDEGGTNETTVAEIRAFIDAGLTSTTNLSLSTKTGTSFKIESSTGADVTIPEANFEEAGLLNATDKVKLDNLSGINTGDQTLESLSAEDVTNKVTDFTTINDTLYPTTQAVDTYLTAQVPPLVEIFIDGLVAQDLQDVTTVGNTTTDNIQFTGGVGVLFDNTSTLRKGTIDAGYGGAKGIAQICSVGYELKWEAGRLYVMGDGGTTIREVSHNFTTTPTTTDDNTKGFIVGSRWLLDNGDLYICSDITTATAVWTLQTIDAVPTDGSTKAVESNGVFDALANKVDKVVGSRLITSAESTLLGNTSGTNTGDQTISDATITTTDITTNNFTTAKHGFVPKGTNVGKFLKDDGTWGTPSAGGLTYFTEAQNTTGVNATVPVDSLTAVTGTTDGDFAIIPKGTGALISQIPDGTTAGGNKRGARAVDFQRNRAGATQVASGTDSSILSGVNNVASSPYSVVLGGSGNSSIANYTLTFGRNAYANGNYAFDFSNNGGATADGGFSFLSGGTASNATSFNGLASGINSFSKNGTASGAGSVVAGGSLCVASGSRAFAMGDTNLANSRSALALGEYSSTKTIASRLSIGTLQDISPYIQGNSQLSIGCTTVQSTTNTALELVAYQGTAIALVLQNNEAIRVRGSIIGKQTASTNVTSYDFDCIIVRGTTAGSTVIKVSNVNLVWDDIICTVLPTLTADTTLGGLSVKSGGKLTTTIKWSCRIDSTESILA